MTSTRGDGDLLDDPTAGLLARGAAVTVRVGSASMSPTAAVGERVTVRPGRGRIGDVVLLRAPGCFVLHRLVARLPGRLVHAGDAPGSRAGLCRPGDVLGVADLPHRAVGARMR